MSKTTLKIEGNLSVLRAHERLMYVPGLTVKTTCPECGQAQEHGLGWRGGKVSDEDPGVILVDFQCMCGTPSRDPPRKYQITNWTVKVRVAVTAVLEQDHG